MIAAVFFICVLILPIFIPIIDGQKSGGLRQKPTKKDPAAIVKEQCIVYAKARYRNVTYESQLPGDERFVTPILDCVIAEPLIRGGTLAISKEFPHMAVIGFGSDDPEKADWSCGGTLISDQFVLSAAHCAVQHHTTPRPAKWARLGELVLESSTDDDTGTHTKDYFIMQHYIHPKYSREQKYNDIALFKLREKVEFNAYVRPICLYTFPNLDNDLNSRAVITGWGSESSVGVSSEALLKAKVDLMNDTACSKHYPVAPDMSRGFDGKTMICSHDEAEGRDTCRGDSGGPLQVPYPTYDCMFYQIGIASFGKRMCGFKNSATVYTQISPFIPWIQSIVWP